ncbi:MAG: TonB-dependent receptor [Rhodocyclaceae bacterium]
MQHATRRFRTTLLACTLAGFGNAHAAGVPTLQEVSVTAASNDLIGVADSAGEGTVTARQLANRPLLRPAEVMETIPGMVVTQHSGDGKANQYFLRGFNLDHGSDFATHVNGMPVNVASHAHGQGYMDLNFLIPELIGSVKYRKGVYAAEDGDFTTTGSARIDYARRLDSSLVDLSFGQHNYRRLLSAGSREVDGLQLLGGVEVAGNDGPWAQPEGFGKTSAVLRLSSGSAANGFALTAMAYEARWQATEHVPERAISSGEIGRYGSLSPNDGGRTHRYSLSGEWGRTDADGARKASAYVIDYGLNLFSAPSGFINGVQGDQHEQADQRTVWGGQGSRSWLLGPALKDSEITTGLQLRHDRVGTLGLYDTQNRQRSTIVREDRVRETAAALYVDLRSQWTPWLRSNLGLRRDEYRAQVTSLAGAFNMGNGGSAAAGQTSPKAGLVFGPFDLLGATEFYANWGHGFHSNDARGATSTTNPKDGTPSEKVPLLVKAKGSEIGLRANPLPGWNTGVSLWRMELASELVFVGDQGVAEPKGGSRRHGLEWSNYLTPTDGVIVDSDLALSVARFKEASTSNGGSHVPNAIPLTASLGLTADRGGRWFGGLRLRYLGAYALEETGEQKSTAFWTSSVKLGYRFDRSLQLTLDVLNLFDRKANDIEYWGAACTRNETTGGNCGAGIDGRLVHPLEPRTLRIGARLSF